MRLEIDSSFEGKPAFAAPSAAARKIWTSPRVIPASIEEQTEIDDDLDRIRPFGLS